MTKRILAKNWLDTNSGNDVYGIAHNHPSEGLVHVMVKKDDRLFHPFDCKTDSLRKTLINEIEKLSEITPELVSGVVCRVVSFIKMSRE